jgi:hypothetical protein
MYKGNANSPNKVWYGGDNLYFTVLTGMMAVFRNSVTASYSTQGDTNAASAPTNGSSIYIPNPMSSLVIARPPQRSSYTF